MYHSIVVPLDGSPFGEQALPLGLSIAQRAETSIDLVHVHVPLAPMYAESAAGLEVHAYELVPWRGMNDDRARSRTEDSGI